MRTNRSKLMLLLTFAILFFCSGRTSAQSAPTLSYTNPVNGPVGTSVTIVGNYFGATQGSSTITFNGTAATPTSWSNTQVVAPVPAGATTGPVVVTVGGTASYKVNFTVGTPPTISYTKPVNGPVGTSVTIVGNYFGVPQGTSTITFNGTAVTPTSWSNTQVVAPVPGGTTTGPVVVTVGGTASNKVNFTVGTPPTISYTNPIDGPAGTSTTIVGNYFGATQGSSTITFNGTAATPTSWSNTQVVAPVPTGATTGPVVVTVGGVASTKVNFTVGTPPTISYTNPIDGPVGTSITIVGNYFGATQGSSTITFNGTAATPTSWSSTQVVVPVPNGASTGPVLITAGGMASNRVNFIVGTPPTISYTNPIDGPVGTSITIVGNYFGSAQGTSTITFNGTAAMPTSWSNTQVVVPVPNGASTGPVVITAGGMPSNRVNFIVGTPPTISYTNPVSGAVSATITIVGNYFGSTQGSSTVTFNGIAATPASWSNTQIAVPVPSGATTGPLVVTAGAIPSNNVNFTVLMTPTITSLSPNSGPVGTSVTITGTNFGASQGTSTLTFNGTAATPTSWSSTGIVVPVPSGATTGNAVVAVSGLVSNGVPFTLTVLPSITSLSPTSGPVGTAVTLTGTNFGAAQGSGTVLLGSTNGVVTHWSDTQVVAVVAPGSTSGTAQILQNGLASNVLSFNITSAPTITSVTPASGAVGTQVTIAGSAFGAAQGSGRILLGSAYGVVVSWSDTQVVATVAQGASSGTAVIFQSGTASNALNFTITTPTLTSVTPASGSAGAQVTITGSGFGAAQGTGKVLLGTAYGVVASWSDIQVVADVASGSSSGTAQILQGGLASNTLNFTVVTPTITSVTPASGMPGTQVTISGSAFGVVQGTGNLWLGSTYGLIVSWSDTQVVATVAPSSTSGQAQILQNGVWSNAIPFSTGILQISSVSPNSGATGTQVAIMGSGFGATQGASVVQLGSSNATVVSWSDTQVTATVSPGSVTGVARIQQNGLSSNSIRFVVPTVGSGNNVTVVPSLISMLVGETRSIQALGSNGAAVKGLTWASSDTTIATLSTDDPPIISAVAPGHVTITAGDSSCDLTVYSGGALPPGTTIWSAPGDGSGVTQILPAVPSISGVADVFALQTSGNVQAVSGDGIVAWTANVGTANTLLPDFEGGLVVSAQSSLMKLDSMTGQQNFSYLYANRNTSSNGVRPVAVHTDGTIFTVDGSSVIGLDPQTGAAKFSILMDTGFTSSQNNCDFTGATQGPLLPLVGRIMIAGDGYAYVLYQFREHQFTELFCNNSTLDELHLRLLRVGPSGDSVKIPIGDWTSEGAILHLSGGATAQSLTSVIPFVNSVGSPTLITNADTGLLLSYTLDFPAFCSGITIGPGDFLLKVGCVPAMHQSKLTVISAGAVTSDTVAPQDFAPILQVQNGTFLGGLGSQLTGTSLGAVDLNGNVDWTLPGYSPQMATADGGSIAQSPSGQFVTLDQNGVTTGQLASLPTQSWRGNAYQFGSVNRVSFQPIIAATLWSFFGGNPSGTGTAGRPWFFILNWQNQFDFIPENPQVLPNLKTDITSQATLIKKTALTALQAAYSQWPVTVVEGMPNTGDHQAVVQTTSTGQGPSCGSTNINVAHPVDSEVWYECNMEQAQVALQIVINNATDEVNALTRQDLIQAIGRGIGNNAAHEIAHQFLIECCSMDNLTSADPGAAGTYNNGSADGSPNPQIINSDPAPYTGFGKSGKPIFWEDTTKQALGNCLGKGWHNYNIPCAF